MIVWSEGRLWRGHPILTGTVAGMPLFRIVPAPVGITGYLLVHQLPFKLTDTPDRYSDPEEAKKDAQRLVRALHRRLDKAATEAAEKEGSS